MKNPLSLKRKTMGQIPNQFHYSQINYNISFVCLTTEEKSLLFFFSITYTLCVSRLNKNLLVFLCSHAHSLCMSKAVTLCSLFLGYLIEDGNPLLSPSWLYLLKGGNTLLSLPWLSSQRRQYFTLYSLVIFSKTTTLTLSSLTIFSKTTTLYSLLLSYLLKGGNHLLSPPWLSSWRWQSFALSSLAIFLRAATICYLLLGYSQAKIFFFLSWFHALFSLSP